MKYSLIAILGLVTVNGIKLREVDMHDYNYDYATNMMSYLDRDGDG